MRFSFSNFFTAIAVVLFVAIFTQNATAQDGNGAKTDDAAPPPANVTGRGVPIKPQTFTGISKPLPGESRYTKDNSPHLKDDGMKTQNRIVGTTTHLVIPSAWYPGVSRAAIITSIDQDAVENSPENQSGGSTTVPTPAPPEPDEIRTLQENSPDMTWQYNRMTPSPLYSGELDDLTTPLDLGEEFVEDAPVDPVENIFNISESENKFASEKIFFSGTTPRPSKYRPVAAGNDVPIKYYYNPYSQIGPPKSLRYGLVSEDSGVLNAPFAPAQASPKVWSNGRPVTMTERAQGAEGYAPIIRWRHTMARHTNVATSLPVYCDGLEHCPVCMRGYLCGCGEENCRFCNPESRLGPAPVCDCCSGARPCIHGNVCKGQLGHSPYREWGNTSGGVACPICKEALERVPCGRCENCKRGITCELYKPCGECFSCSIGEKCDLYRAHRDCILPSKSNSCTRCDVRINGEPCGTCDWCRENSGLNHEPCGHQEVGLLKAKTVYNPYNEPKLFSAPPRFITNRFNNNASRFPIYYNPAPYYKNMHNPSTFTGFGRPFQMRYTCEMCRHNPCTCTAPGNAGQVAYAFACKFCNRNPCACAAEICNSNMDLNPKEIHLQREKLRESEKPTFEAEEQVQDTADTGFTPTRPPQDDQTSTNVWDVPRAPGDNGPANAVEVLPDDNDDASDTRSDLEKILGGIDSETDLDRLYDEKSDEEN